MRAQLARAGTPGPKAIGIDELSIRKGHTYRIVVSDLIRRRPIWFGGEDRSEKSMALFYDWLGPNKTHGIRLAVMDMWKPFRNVTAARAPQAAILFDKFHIMRHLGEALDKVRKAEYARLSGRDRRFIKGQMCQLSKLLFAPIAMPFHVHDQVDELPGLLSNHEGRHVLEGIQRLAAATNENTEVAPPYIHHDRTPVLARLTIVCRNLSLQAHVVEKFRDDGLGLIQNFVASLGKDGGRLRTYWQGLMRCGRRGCGDSGLGLALLCRPRPVPLGLAGW